MRFTPYLDSLGVGFSEEPDVDRLVNIIDSTLAQANASIRWGVWAGKRRKPCPEQPLLLTGAPIGQYHCPSCGMMILAAMPHPSPVGWSDDMMAVYDYEVEYEQPWPPGYEEELPPAVESGKTFLHLSLWHRDTLLYTQTLERDIQGFTYEVPGGMTVTSVKIEST